MPLYVVALALSLLLGLFSAQKLYEDDLHWQLRAGEELVQSRSFPTTEQWSYTVKGQPWLNYEWLSCVLLYGVHAAAGDAGCVALRVALVAVLFLLLFALMAAAEGGLADHWLVVLGYLPTAYLAMSFRLQLRPELFGLLLFQALILVWQPKLTPWRKVVLSAVFILIGANLHAGTAIFLLFLALGLAAFERAPWREKAVWGLVFCVAYFATPLHWRILPILNQHFHYLQTILNLEWQGFEVGQLNVGAHGWPVALSVLLMGMSAWAYWKVYLSDPADAAATRNILGESGFYQNKWAVLAFGAVFAALSFSRIRMFPYVTLFFSPVVVQALAFSERARRAPSGFQATRKASRRRMAPAVAVAMLWGVVFPMQLSRSIGHWGFELDQTRFSPRLASFIAEHKPKPNLFSGFLMGSSQLWWLRDYPVFLDARDVVFNPVKGEFLEAIRSVQGFTNVVRKYDINTVTLSFLSNPLPGAGGGAQDPILALVPPEQWGLVYFDNRLMLFLKRVPEHDDLLAKYEYRVLRPTLSAAAYPGTQIRSRGDAERLFQELARCEAEEPDNIHCLALHAVLLQLQDDPAKRAQIPTVLEHAEQVARLLGAAYYGQVIPAYRFVGWSERAAKLEEKVSEALASGPGF